MSTENTKIIGVDPGTKHGAYAVWDFSLRKIVEFGDIENEKLLTWLRTQTITGMICCETIQAYGQAVGAETFETCFFIGQVMEICHYRRQTFVPVKRKEVIFQHCCSQKATDAQIRQAMISYIGEPGNRKVPGPTYGITGHIWSALSIATYLSCKAENEQKIEELRAAKNAP